MFTKAFLLPAAVLVALSASGGLATNATVAHATTVTSTNQIKVIAKSDMAQGVGGHFTVAVNGTIIGQATANSTTPKTYTFTYSKNLTNFDTIAITYDNDGAPDGVDRNLYLISVNGKVPSTNSYTKSDDHSVNTPGGNGLLPWNGTVVFGPTLNKYGATSNPNLRSSAPIIAVSGQVIDGVRITSGVDSGGLTGCVVIPDGVHNVVVRNSDLSGCSNGEGVVAGLGAHDIEVSNNVIHNVATGFYANHSLSPLTFKNNTVTDIIGPFPRGQMVQFDNVSGTSGSNISYNTSDDRSTASNKSITHVEDHINLYMSNGSPTNPITVRCNKLAGGDSHSGSGIMLGDNGGSYQLADHNSVVATANTGIAISGGNHISMTNNIIANDGPAGSLTENIGYVANFTNGGADPSDITVVGNRGRATENVSPNELGQIGYDNLYGFWNPLNLDVSNNNWHDLSITANTQWNQDIPTC